MSEKTLRTVLAAVGGLILVYAIAAVATGGPDGSFAEDSALAAAFDAFREGGLERVAVTGPEATLELSRSTGGWTVNGFPADSGAVARLEQTLREIRVGHLASANPANHARLGVVEDSARVLELTHQDGDVVRLLVGEAGTSYPSAYVRLPDSEQVYLVHGDLRGPARRDLDEWRDRTILRVDTAAVASIRVTRDGASYTLSRDSAGWRVSDAEALTAGAPANAGADAPGAPAQELLVRDILSQLDDLRAIGFADAGTQPGEAVRTIVAYSEDGTELARITLAEGDGSNFLATTPGKDAVFELQSWRADRLAPEREEVEGGAGG